MARGLIAVVWSCLAVVLGAQTAKPHIDTSRLAETGSPNLAMETPRAETEWDKGTHISIHIKGERSDITCRYGINDSKNILITESGHLGSEPRNGQIMLIDGRWILTKNVPVAKGYEIDELDHPLLDLKLLMYLLSDLAPQGPSEIKKKTSFPVKKGKRSFTVATVSAYEDVEAPWKLEGTIDPLGPTKYAFDLELKNARGSSHLTGTWRSDNSSIGFPNDTPLSGWQIYEIGTDRRQQGRTMLYDYVAKPSTLNPRTVGDLRRLAQE